MLFFGGISLSRAYVPDDNRDEQDSPFCFLSMASAAVFWGSLSHPRAPEPRGREGVARGSGGASALARLACSQTTGHRAVARGSPGRVPSCRPY